LFLTLIHFTNEDPLTIYLIDYQIFNDKKQAFFHQSVSSKPGIKTEQPGAEFKPSSIGSVTA